MPARDGIDVADLPTYSFGHRGPIWWGNLGYLAIEGTAFALGIVVYLYYRVIGGGPWPPYLPPPDLLWGTLNLVLFLVSIPPNHWAKKAAESEDLWGVRRWLLVSLGFGAAILAVRGVEFTA